MSLSRKGWIRWYHRNRALLEASEGRCGGGQQRNYRAHVADADQARVTA